MFNRLRRWLGRGRGENGSVAVELGIIVPVVLFLIVGGLDFAHSYYIKHIITSASREGARYAAKYTGSSSAPSETEVANYIKLPSPNLNYNAHNLDTLTVNTTYAGTFPNKIATVTVTAVKHWWVLGTFNFFGWHNLTNPQTLTAATAMNVEH
jgi:Flp pilus assembly protein TadG